MSNIFSVRLVEARESKGWNRSKLSLSSGISISLLGQYEKGAYAPSILNAAILANALGVSLDWLVGLTDNKEVQK